MVDSAFVALIKFLSVNVIFELLEHCTTTSNILLRVFAGVEDDDTPADDSAAAASTEDMPPLEGDEDDASRMEEVD